jgi:hypothetical protein
MDKSMSFREIQNAEEESTSGRTSTSSLDSMFADNKLRSLNHASIEEIETQPQAAWKLPAISPSRVYNDLSMFHLKAVSRVIVKESVSRIQQNSDVSQTISLINVKEVQAEARKHKTNYLHFGCIRVGINPLVHKGIEAYALCTVRDMTHNKFTDSLIGGIVAPLSNGPVYFDCFPNFSVYTFDDNLGDILKLQIRTTGFDMCQTRTNIAIQTRGCFRHTNTLYPAVLNTPSQTSQSSTLVITDPLNQKMEHHTIRWENLSFPTNWVIDTPKAQIPRSITSANIQESSSSAIISFPQSLQTQTKHAPISSPTLCLHPSLQALTSSLGNIPYSIQCPDCSKLVTLSNLPTHEEEGNFQFEHSHHNPRTNLPPTNSTAKEPCPHPQCSDFPFPHEPHVLVITTSSYPQISQRYEILGIPTDIRKPSAPEIRKFFSLMKGCPKHLVKEDWMKEMLNWDLFTHPAAKGFSTSSTNEEKQNLSRKWQQFMTEKSIFISFYEWKFKQQRLENFKNKTFSLPSLVPLQVRPICCSVQTISISDLGKEISKLKREIKVQKEQEGKNEDNILSVYHQKFHVLLNIKIQDKLFRLKTLLDTGSDLNLLNKDIIPVQFWHKTKISAVGLGNIPTEISYEIPEATLCFRHHCLSLKVFAGKYTSSLYPGNTLFCSSRTSWIYKVTKWKIWLFH